MNTEHNKGYNAFKISENWEKQSQQLKKQFSQLKDSDLVLDKGKEDELLERIGNKLSKNREEVIKILNDTQFS
ncbi:hypothetical protein [Chryseobacterium geocarposphaerae]|uniref:General stress protein CsbD n=1 Tax=Chryseobacterium geocarposphaerae TaxID=1416776 RepID=A0A2M9C8Y9_9FLAO|nr:hypothetical protein [Chryseobacterium geocarposphaerae]PJJ67310.1 hypothetical protein CLV73_1314 [Chryseobacterium geocarposphaerae]